MQPDGPSGWNCGHRLYFIDLPSSGQCGPTRRAFHDGRPHRASVDGSAVGNRGDDTRDRLPRRRDGTGLGEKGLAHGRRELATGIEPIRWPFGGRSGEHSIQLGR